MVEKTKIMTYVAVVGILISAICLSFILIYGSGPRTEYDATTAKITYPEVNDTIFSEVCEILEEISFDFGRGRNGALFDFYHRDNFSNIDERYEIFGHITNGRNENLSLHLQLSGTNDPIADKEMLEKDLVFIKDLLYSLLNEPLSEECGPRYGSGYWGLSIVSEIILYSAIMVLVLSIWLLFISGLAKSKREK